MNKKKLILVRHGDAELPNLTKLMNDHGRELTSFGKNKIVKLTKILKGENLNILQIISSTALRTIETAKILSEKLLNNHNNFQTESSIYNGNLKDYISLFNSINNLSDSVIIVGHSPHITEFGEFLVNKPIGHLQPGGVIFIEFHMKDWKEIKKRNGKLIFVKNFLDGTFEFA